MPVVIDEAVLTGVVCVCGVLCEPAVYKRLKVYNLSAERVYSILGISLTHLVL